eukprot:TRINITY_DN1970_c0_g1_i2.p1 TRINITY_DN1970_c0_g1~~TRINITY_DN1970_c0_g1_i2.p1  ORF type:complete len:170 (-),score=14.26 TRINITY_DN1970_c0_g1_i2:86-595(-)
MPTNPALSPPGTESGLLVTAGTMLGRSFKTRFCSVCKYHRCASTSSRHSKYEAVFSSAAIAFLLLVPARIPSSTDSQKHCVVSEVAPSVGSAGSTRCSSAASRRFSSDISAAEKVSHSTSWFTIKAPWLRPASSVGESVVAEYRKTWLSKKVHSSTCSSSSSARSSDGT